MSAFTGKMFECKIMFSFHKREKIDRVGGINKWMNPVERRIKC